MRVKADLVLFLVAVLWGSAFAAQRAAGIIGSVYVFNAARFLLAGILLLPFACRTRLGRGQLVWMLVAGGILFVASALQQSGMRSTTAGNAGFLTSLYVVLVPVALLVGWGERPAAPSLVGIVLAGLGAYLLSGGGELRFHGGDLLELAGAVFWSLHVVLLGKYAFRYDAVSFSAGQLLVASSLNWLASATWEPVVFPVPDALIAAILYTAVVSLGIGYTLQIWGQRHAPPTDAALILSAEAVFAAAGGALVLNERLGSTQLVGCGLIALAVLVSQIRGWSKISAGDSG